MELPVELIRAARLVRRIGINLNQAVARLNVTSQGRRLEPGNAMYSQVVQRIGDAADRFVGGLP